MTPTKGPWAISLHPKSLLSIKVVGSDNNYIPNHLYITGKDDVIIAVMISDQVSSTELVSNAQLIALAPDLLEKARNLITALQQNAPHETQLKELSAIVNRFTIH
jgi:hypothetical protein